jgi:putative MFS transporter
MGSAYGMGGIGRMFGPLILSLFAGAGTLVTPKATTGAIRPVWTLFALCAVVLFITYYYGKETKNKSIDEIEKMLGSPDAPKEPLKVGAR